MVLRMCGLTPVPESSILYTWSCATLQDGRKAFSFCKLQLDGGHSGSFKSKKVHVQEMSLQLSSKGVT